MTFSLKKDFIKKVGYEKIIDIWDSLNGIDTRHFICRNKKEVYRKYRDWTPHDILKHINPKGFNVEKHYVYINRKGQISSTVSARRMIKERIIDVQYIFDNWYRVPNKYKELFKNDNLPI